MMKRSLIALGGLSLATLSVGTSAEAATIFALTDSNRLISFDSSTPANLTGVGPIVDSVTGDGIQDLIGIDFRPSTGLLYGVGTGSAIYTIDINTGSATRVGTLSTTLAGPRLPLQGSRFGIDFNPVPDNNPSSPPSYRIIGDTGQNLRADVDTGVTTVDASLGSFASIVGAAYTNSNQGPTTELDLNGAPATLYGIDSVTDQLVRFTNPNAGTFVTQGGSLGINASNLAGFDIFFDGATNVAYAALQDAPNGVSQLYTIDLVTGAATLAGTIGGGDFIDGLTVVPEPASAALLAGIAGLGLFRRSRKI
jgi:hypothetical protein